MEVFSIRRDDLEAMCADIYVSPEWFIKHLRHTRLRREILDLERRQENILSQIVSTCGEYKLAGKRKALYDVLKSIEAQLERATAELSRT